MLGLLACGWLFDTIWVSDLDLTKASQGWGTPHKNQSVEGHTIRLGETDYSHGFGTHSPGRLAIDVHGTASRFRSMVGIDGEVPGGKGSAEFEVFGDGKILWRSGILRRESTPKAADVDLTGVRRVTLVVTTGGDGFEYDHADWADARIDYSGTAPVTATWETVELPIAPVGPPPARGYGRPSLRVVAAVPPMGWNSYDGFGDSVTEAEMLANARFVATKMKPFGWDTVVVDYRWYDPGAHDNNANGRAGAALTMDSFGRLLPAPNRFPSAADGRGFKPLADQVHALGLKFGIHIMRGIPRQALSEKCPVERSSFTALDAGNPQDPCPWCADMFGVRGATEAGQAYYDSIFRLYASWGVDFVKMDDTSAPYHTDEIDAVRKAIDKCGRRIVYSLSPGETPISDASHVAAHANMWRVSGDFWDNWGSLDHEFDLAKRWQGVGGPGHWPDADMLPLGHLSVAGRSVGPDRRCALTHNEQVTLLSLWCLLPSPLMLGGNAPDLDAWTLALLTNPEVLALNQGPSGSSATLASEDGDVEVWVRALAQGRAVGIFNRGEVDRPVSYPASLVGKKVRDLWQRKDAGPLRAGETVLVPAHGAVLFRVSG